MPHAAEGGRANSFQGDETIRSITSEGAWLNDAKVEKQKVSLKGGGEFSLGLSRAPAVVPREASGELACRVTANARLLESRSKADEATVALHHAMDPLERDRAADWTCSHCKEGVRLDSLPRPASRVCLDCLNQSARHQLENDLELVQEINSSLLPVFRQY